MLFNSHEFLFLFLPVTALVFFLLGRRGLTRLAMAWLVAASLFYYGWWDFKYLALIGFSILFNFATGSALAGRYAWLPRSRPLLVLAVAVNLALLGWFKYANFFVDTVALLSGSEWTIRRIILPLGISFFTFQQIAYLVDAWQGLTKEYNFVNYCLFVSFFPQLIAGPIVHHKDMMPQFEQRDTYRFNHRDVAVGITIFSIGLFKKVVFADTAALYASPVFDAAARGLQPTFAEAWAGALAYTLQLYFDFSGYSDMAIGAGRLFGIRLPVNFNSPYKAVNIIDFWRRWHITLSRFLRDYLYIPLGGNRHGRARRHINLMITMLLGGLWHGAGWNFVFWGGWHGIYLVINHGWRHLRGLRGHDLERSTVWSRAAGRTITLFAVIIAWVFFRAANLETSVRLLESMFGLADAAGRITVYEMKDAWRWIVPLMLFTQFVPNTQQWLERFHPALYAKMSAAIPPVRWGRRLWRRAQWRPNVVWALITAAIALAAVLSLVRESEFIYFQF